LKQRKVDNRVDVGNPGICGHQSNVAKAQILRVAAKGMETLLDVSSIERATPRRRSAEVLARFVSAYSCLYLGRCRLLLSVKRYFLAAPCASACGLEAIPQKQTDNLWRERQNVLRQVQHQR